jgi:hypothetical protein
VSPIALPVFQIGDRVSRAIDLPIKPGTGPQPRRYGVISRLLQTDPDAHGQQQWLYLVAWDDQSPSLSYLASGLQLEVAKVP